MSDSAPGPQNLSNTHREIARWLLENPGKYSVRDCALHFKYSLPWISTLIHSDAFRALMIELQKDADNLVVNDIPAKLRGVAALAIEGLGESVEAAMSDKSTLLHRGFLKETVDMTLTKLGYSSKPPTGPAPMPPHMQQNNYFLGPVAPEVLQHAREKLLTMEVPAATVSEASQLPASIESPEREVQR